ncbi:MAG: hypothetical protein ABJA80_03075 [bacterium]
MAPADASGGDVAFAVDVLVTWVGAAALARFVIVLGRHRHGTPLEPRARFLFGTVAALLFLRGFSWLWPESTALAFLTFVPVSLLPIPMTVLAEGLLRRHVPRWMKVLATTVAAMALLANLTRFVFHGEAAVVRVGMVTLGALVVTLVALGVVLLQRDRASLSRSENALVRVSVIATAIALPLVATDFRFDLGWPMVRLGTLGTLLLCFTLLRQPQENVLVSRWLADVGRLVVRAVFFGGLVAIALQSTAPSTLVPILVLGVAIVLAFAVLDRLSDVERTTLHTQLLRWLAREQPATWQQFARELRALPLTADADVLDEPRLQAYDRASVIEAFPSHTVVQSLANLRALRESTRQLARGADELSDLLERTGATHVGLLSANPLRLLVATVPDLSGLRDVELSLAAVVRRGQRVGALDG